MTENRKDYCRDILNVLEQKDRELDEKTKRAEIEASQARQQRADLQGAIKRAQLSPPANDICPSCWITHGKHSKLTAATHEDPSNYDRLECKACGYFEDIRNG